MFSLSGLAVHMTLQMYGMSSLRETLEIAHVRISTPNATHGLAVHVQDGTPAFIRACQASHKVPAAGEWRQRGGLGDRLAGLVAATSRRTRPWWFRVVAKVARSPM
jgi:hypothetical protein